MELVSATAQVPRRGTGNWVAIGKWDGVHLAHQAIIKELVRSARAAGGQSVVIGFHPLPMAVLRPEQAPPVIQTLEERSETLAALGVDVHLAIPFSLAFSDMQPEQFVRDVLVGELQAQQVMVGFNFTFGRGGKATANDLARLCQESGVPVRIVEPVREVGESVSSSLVRFYAANGQMERARDLLGRPFAVTGMVVGGDKRGRTIGYPTANVHLPERRQLPATGVYVVEATVLQGAPTCGALPCQVSPRTGPTYGGMCNIGWRPTFNGKDLRCEVHLFDFQGDLYGKVLRVQFLSRLRAEKAFSGIDALIEQLKQDEEAARAFLGALGNDTAR